MSESATSQSPGRIDAGSIDLPINVGAVSDTRRRMSYAILALACAAGLGFMIFKHGPRSAGASDVSQFSQEMIGDSVTNDATKLRQLDTALKTSDEVIAGFRFSPARVQIPLSELRANPFRKTASNGTE